MAFRDLLSGVEIIDDEVSVNHDMYDLSISSGNSPMIFTSIKESPGHSAVMNVLARDRLCELYDLTPGELIDILAWAMKNPVEPVLIDRSKAAVLENTQKDVDLTKLPIPWHYREDRGRYQSASVIIAQYNGIRNMSFHRQFLRDTNHCVSRFVPRHLRTMTDKAKENGDDVENKICFRECIV